jgi:hypothetical protein
MNWFIIISISNVHTLIPIAANFVGLRDWIRAFPYDNLIKQARVWVTVEKPWDGNARFDPKTDWPTQDFGVVLATDYVDMGGKYLLFRLEQALL